MEISHDAVLTPCFCTFSRKGSINFAIADHLFTQNLNHEDEEPCYTSNLKKGALIQSALLLCILCTKVPLRPHIASH